MSNNNPKKKHNKKQNSDILDNININKINDPKKEREKIQYQIIKEVLNYMIHQKMVLFMEPILKYY